MRIHTKPHLPWYYKWIVLGCAFCNYVIVDGLRFSFGILYVELLDTFGSGRGETAWIGSLQVGLANLGGVIAGSVVRHFGIRKTIIAGTLLSCAGLIASGFTSSIYAMYVTYGVLPGFGFVMMSLANIFAVSQNFDKQQSLAMGICQAGASIGGFIFNPLLQMLIETYGWQGALLIMAGVLLHGWLIAVVIHTFGQNDRISNDKQNIEEKQTNAEAAEENAMEHDLFIPKDDKQSTQDENLNAYEAEITATEIDVFSPKDDIAMEYFDSYVHIELPRISNNTIEDVDKDVQNSLNCHADQKSISSNNGDELKALKHADINVDRKGVSEQSAKSKATHKGILSIFLHVIHNVFPYKVLNDRPTFIFLISAHVRSFGFFVPFVLLPDLAVDRNITIERAAWLASGMGISGAVSRILLGWIGDFKSVDRVYLFIACLLGSGVLSAVCPSFYLYWLLMVYACLFGSLMGGECSLTPVICSDVAGRDRLAETYGMLQTLCGVGAICGTPLSGWLFEVTGSYNVSFILAGSLITLSGILLLPLKCQSKK